MNTSQELTVGQLLQLFYKFDVSSLPVVIGPGGVARVVAPALDAREQVLLENALSS